MDALKYEKVYVTFDSVEVSSAYYLDADQAKSGWEILKALLDALLFLAKIFPQQHLKEIKGSYVPTRDYELKPSK